MERLFSYYVEEGRAEQHAHHEIARDAWAVAAGCHSAAESACKKDNGGKEKGVLIKCNRGLLLLY
jgi:hypothetical protein